MMSEQLQPTPEGVNAPRYATLADYIRVIRRRRPIIVLLTVVGLLIGAATVLTREETYSASASLSYRDITQELTLIGIDASPEEAPATRAAISAELVTGPEVTAAVAERFEGQLTAGELAAATNARVAVQTQLVVVTATADDPELAAEIANAYAEEARRIGNRDTDRRLGRVERSLTQELRRLDRRRQDAEEASSGIGFRISSLESRLTVVQTLRDTARTVELVQRASPPAQADGIGLVASMGLGGLLGLVLGLLGAFVREALDGRIHSTQEAHAASGLPVLGRVRESALGQPGLARNGSEPMEEVDFEAFRVLRTNLRYLQQHSERPVRSLLVTSARPEEGKSTVSMGLASAAALAGWRVLLVEADLRRPCFAERLGVPPAPGLADYLRGSAEPKEVVRATELTKPRHLLGPGDAAQRDGAGSAGLAYIAAGGAGSDSSELLASGRFGGFVAAVRDGYDLVILDSAPILAVGDPLELVEHSDAIVYCIRANASTRGDAGAARAVLTSLPPRPSLAVVTGLPLSGPGSYEYHYGY